MKTVQKRSWSGTMTVTTMTSQSKISDCLHPQMERSKTSVPNSTIAESPKWGSHDKGWSIWVWVKLQFSSTEVRVELQIDLNPTEPTQARIWAQGSNSSQPRSHSSSTQPEIKSNSNSAQLDFDSNSDSISILLNSTWAQSQTSKLDATKPIADSTSSNQQQDPIQTQIRRGVGSQLKAETRGANSMRVLNSFGLSPMRQPTKQGGVQPSTLEKPDDQFKPATISNSDLD